MSKVVWFLDIDGVINCFPAPRVAQLTDNEFINVKVLGYQIWYRPELIDFINEVHASGLIEIRWNTTWKDLAVTELAPAVGIKHKFDVEGDQVGSRYPSDANWWKSVNVRLYMQENPDAHVIWTDDDLAWHLREVGIWPELKDENEHLVIAPAGNPGLTDEHLALIKSFADRHALDKYLIV